MNSLMPENELNKAAQESEWIVQAIPFCVAIALSVFGGIVNYVHRMDKHGMAFSLFRLMVDIFTSGFVGIVSFMLCDAAGLGWSTTAAVVAISGHMGTRALFLIEKAAEKFAVNFIEKGECHGDSERKTERNEEENN